jgi:tetraacyldisaccharide 4'-kinase
MYFLRKLLFPFSLLYGIVIGLRSLLYSTRLKKSQRVHVPLICVGNIRVGGTGKTPLVAHLASYFDEQVGIVSRGYGRKTRGVLEVTKNHAAIEVGDEPLIYKHRFADRVPVFVSENRVVGVEALKLAYPQTQCVLLDDAFQHRKISADCSVIVTDFAQPFWRDYLMPMGNLREFRSAVRRAQVVLISKCPELIPKSFQEEAANFLERYQLPYFFSKLVYGKPTLFSGQPCASFDTVKSVFLVTGIANPKPLMNFLEKTKEVHAMNYPDHYNFKRSDIDAIHHKFDIFAGGETLIITTEKDFMRLKSIVTPEEMVKYVWCFIPISIKIEREEEFKALIKSYVTTD